jgi:hypothetical protein
VRAWYRSASQLATTYRFARFALGRLATGHVLLAGLTEARLEIARTGEQLALGAVVDLEFTLLKQQIVLGSLCYLSNSN